MLFDPITNELVGLATTPRFEFRLWDLALQSESDHPYIFKTVFNTGPNAIRCFKLHSGIPESEPLKWFGSADIGYIIEPTTGIYAAKYQFIALEEPS